MMDGLMKFPRQTARCNFIPTPAPTSIPHPPLYLETSADSNQADEGATLRTRKFQTNRLLNRKQFVCRNLLCG